MTTRVEMQQGNGDSVTADIAALPATTNTNDGVPRLIYTYNDYEGLTIRIPLEDGTYEVSYPYYCNWRAAIERTMKRFGTTQVLIERRPSGDEGEGR